MIYTVHGRRDGSSEAPQSRTITIRLRRELFTDYGFYLLRGSQVR